MRKDSETLLLFVKTEKFIGTVVDARIALERYLKKEFHKSDGSVAEQTLDMSREKLDQVIKKAQIAMESVVTVLSDKI